jgi:hypothetical protein
MLDQQANDLVWDPVNQVIYLSVSSGAYSNPNTILVLDPLTGSITKSVSIGNDPDVLALSAGSQYLYVGLDGSSLVQRLTLPDLSPDVNYSLGSDPIFGPYIALDLQVAPADPHTTAVTSGSPLVDVQALGGITIYDDVTPRQTSAAGFGPTADIYDSLQWGSDDTTLYAANNEDSSCDFYTLAVNSSGITLTKDYPNTFSPATQDLGMKIHYDAGTQRIYDDDGSVVDPSTGLLLGNFTPFGPTYQRAAMVPDSTLNAAFFVSQASYDSGTIESFDIAKFTSIANIQIPYFFGTPLRIIRWGTNGLAFITEGSPPQVFVISGSIVTKAN